MPITAKGRHAPPPVSRTRCSASSAVHRRAGTHHGSPRLLGPGSAAHHSANAPCCAAHGTRYRHDFAFSRRDFARVMQIRLRLCEQRAQGMPGARCTRGLVCKNAHCRRTRAYRAAETLRHPLRNGFTAYFVLSPVERACCHRHYAGYSPRNLAPASRRQDHTTSPYALAFSSGVKNA